MIPFLIDPLLYPLFPLFFIPENRMPASFPQARYAKAVDNTGGRCSGQISFLLFKRSSSSGALT